MTSYSEQHANPSSQEEVENVFGYVVQTLSAAQPVPSDIHGTVSAMIATSRELRGLLVTVGDNGTATAVQKQQVANLDSEYTTDGSTLTKWWKANC